MATTTTEITARLNNHFTRVPCALCDDSDRTSDIQFLAAGDLLAYHGYDANVCATCAAKHAPDLYAAVDRLWAAGWQGIQDERVQAVLPYDEPVTVERLESAVAEFSRIMSEASGEIHDYLRKPLVKRLQLDGWLNFPPGDSFMVPDRDGDVLMSTTTRERHRSGTFVRIWIDPNADPENVIRLLAKLTDWYRRGHESLLDDASPF